MAVQLANTKLTYGAVSRVLHWAFAICFLIALVLGYLAAQIGTGNPDESLAERREIYLFFHKSLALLILAFLPVRVVWALRSITPPLAAYMPRIEKLAAKAVHYALYLLMLIAPLSGILLSQSADQPVPFFGLFELPTIVPVDEATPVRERPGLQLGVLLHKTILPWIIYGAVALHIAGLLKHVLVDRDPSSWRRMWPPILRQ